MSNKSDNDTLNTWFSKNTKASAKAWDKHTFQDVIALSENNKMTIRLIEKPKAPVVSAQDKISKDFYFYIDVLGWNTNNTKFTLSDVDPETTTVKDFKDNIISLIKQEKPKRVVLRLMLTIIIYRL